MTESKCALSVDDDEMWADLVARILKTMGYEVGVANSGEAAILKLERRDYSLVVCDQNMKKPGMRGLEVLRWMRKNERYQTTTFILNSGNPPQELVAEVEQLEGLVNNKNSGERLQDALARLLGE